MEQGQRENQSTEHIRNLVVAWLREHRATCSDPDCAEPHNLIAFLAHSAGIRLGAIGQLASELGEYEARCQGCTHLRN